MSVQAGLPGHNRGKKWVPGVGYRYPPRKPGPLPKCVACGEVPQNGSITVVVGVQPIRVETYCKAHARDRWG